MGRPTVVVHAAVSLDGATTGFDVDLGLFYGLVQTWDEDVTLVGADTVLAQEAQLAAEPGPGPAADGALLAVVDSRCRVRQWQALRDAGYWSDVVALRSAASPAAGDDVPTIVAGAERVDLGAALVALGEDRGASVVRVDSGGALIGALLADALVDELSLLVHPCTAGGRAWHGDTPAPARAFELITAEPLEQGVVWLRYRAR